MSSKKVLIFAVVACVFWALVFGVFLVYRVGMMAKGGLEDPVGMMARGEEWDRGTVQGCLENPEQHGWEYPERCVEKLGWSAEEYDDRRPAEVGGAVEDPQTLPMEYWVREQVHLARLRVGSSFRPDAKARREVGADLVRLAGEIEAAGYRAPMIPMALFQAGAYEEAVATVKDVYDEGHSTAVRAAMMVGTEEALGELKRLPVLAERSQVSVVAGLCLAREMEEAKKRIRFLLEHRQGIRGPGLPLESLVLACGIEPREVGIEEIAATSMDAAQLHALLLALNEDREVTKGLVDRQREGGWGWFLPAAARYIVQQEPSLEEVLEMLGYVPGSPRMRVSSESHYCPGMGSELSAPLAAGRVLEAGARRVLELEAGEGGSYFLREIVRREDGEVQTRQWDVEMAAAQKEASEMLFLKAARHYLHVGKRQEAREILTGQQWRRDGSREVCLATLWLELGEWEEAEKWLPEEGWKAHPERQYVRDLMLRAALLKGEVEEGRAVTGAAWEEGQDGFAWPWMAYALLQNEEERSVLKEDVPAEVWELSSWVMVKDAIALLALPEEELRRERSKGQRRWNLIMFEPWVRTLNFGHLAGSDDVEVWLDRFGARQPSLSEPGWREMVHRQEAARLRGDQAAVEAWDRRLAGLLEMVESPEQVWLLNQL